jgi:hypothetical protein
MKWTVGYNYFEGRRKRFRFCIYPLDGSYYVRAFDIAKGVRFSSLWVNITFDSILDAKQFCLNFDPSQYTFL